MIGKTIFVGLFFFSLGIAGGFAQVAQSKATTADSCGNRPPTERIECGWPGIAQEQCEARGCCFDSSFRNSLWCFKNDEHTKDADFTNDEIEGSIARSCSVNAADREDCGWPSIKKEVCENRGCCYSKEVKRTYWCFQPKTAFTQPVVQVIMECTAECASLSWRKAVRVGALCQTRLDCWIMKQGVVEATCMSACKKMTNVLDFVGNVSSCLNLSDNQRKRTENRCEFDVFCWVQMHGMKAATCFRMFSTFFKGVPATDYGTVARQPPRVIQMPRHPVIPPSEQNRAASLPRPPAESDATHPDVERSRVSPVEDLTEEEAPNPWWEAPVRA